MATESIRFLSKEQLIEEAIRRFGICYDEILMPIEVIKIYDAIQPENEITLRQVEAATRQITDQEFCSKDDLIDILQDLDRRNFLLRDFKWEFEFLDYKQSGCIPEDRGYFLFCAVHGKNLKHIWDEFISERKEPKMAISFDEISTILCDVMVADDEKELEAELTDISNG
eukprot:Seg708.6 transcript_id=Seg708.6/GoldUCD/mRNA.D3Y31 product="hypothetical protein" protein_id=Seg708.6/GoldUCD/D3Y31